MGLILFIINGPLAIQVGSKLLANNRSKLDMFFLFIGVGGFSIVYFANISRVLTAVVGLLVCLITVLLFVNRKRFSLKARQNVISTISEDLKPISEGASSPILSILFTLVLVIPLAAYTQGPGTFIRPENDTAELINFVKTLPQNTLIAGYPCLLDDVPLYSQHSILFSCETESRDMGMMMKALDAYFAESDAEVLAFCEEYSVDYMIVSQENFAEAFISQEYIIFEPLNSFLKQQLEGRSSFVLNQIPDNSKTFQNRTLFAFPCRADAFPP